MVIRNTSCGRDRPTGSPLTPRARRGRLARRTWGSQLGSIAVTLSALVAVCAALPPAGVAAATLPEQWTVTSVDITTPAGAQQLAPVAMNDAGHVLFRDGQKDEAFLWSPAAGMVQIEVPGSTQLFPHALNNHDQVVGVRTILSGPDTTVDSWVWSPEAGARLLAAPQGWAEVWAVNDAGQIAGGLYDDVNHTGPQPTRWEPDGTVTRFESPFPGSAVAIGLDGTIAGTWNDNGAGTAFVARDAKAVTPTAGVGLGRHPSVSDQDEVPMTTSGLAQWRATGTRRWPGTGLVDLTAGSRSGLILGGHITTAVGLPTVSGSFVWDPTTGSTTELSTALAPHAIGSAIDRAGAVVGVSLQELGGRTTFEGTFWSATNQAVALGATTSPALMNDHHQVVAFRDDRFVLLQLDLLAPPPSPPDSTTTTTSTVTTTTMAAVPASPASSAVGASPRFAG